MFNVIFENFLTEGYEIIEGDESLLNNFALDFASQKRLFYPSAGYDIIDLFYVRENRFSELNHLSPKIYMHCDGGWNRTSFLQGTRKFFEYPNLEIKDSCHVKISQNREISIFKIGRRNEEEIWLIYFFGCCNEEILKFLLYNKIRINVIYSVCDGMTAGMGCPPDESGIVPTILYPFFYTQLGVKLQITDQNIEWVQYLMNDSYHSARFRKWLNNILLLGENRMVTELLGKSDEKLLSSVLNYLNTFKEVKVNSENELRIPEHRCLKSMVIKYAS